MKCPLITQALMSKRYDSSFTGDNCLKEECAWWVKASESCAMEAIPRIIGFVGNELKDIKNNMPHEGQFRK